MEMLKKLFNSKSKYYLELDDTQNPQPVPTAVKTSNKVANAAQEKVAELQNSKPVQEAEKTANKVIDAAQEKLQSATTVESKPAAKKATTKVESSKNGKQPSKKGAKDATPATQAQPITSLKNSGASSYEPPFWVAAMYNNNGSANNSNGSRAEQTFATDNLMPTITKYRRRPGPSLNKFKDMASKTKAARF